MSNRAVDYGLEKLSEHSESIWHKSITTVDIQVVAVFCLLPKVTFSRETIKIQLNTFQLQLI